MYSTSGWQSNSHINETHTAVASQTRTIWKSSFGFVQRCTLHPPSDIFCKKPFKGRFSHLQINRERVTIEWASSRLKNWVVRVELLEYNMIAYPQTGLSKHGRKGFQAFVVLNPQPSGRLLVYLFKFILSFRQMRSRESGGQFGAHLRSGCSSSLTN